MLFEFYSEKHIFLVAAAKISRKLIFKLDICKYDNTKMENENLLLLFVCILLISFAFICTDCVCFGFILMNMAADKEKMYLCCSSSALFSCLRQKLQGETFLHVLYLNNILHKINNKNILVLLNSCTYLCK